MGIWISDARRTILTHSAPGVNSIHGANRHRLDWGSDAKSRWPPALLMLQSLCQRSIARRRGFYAQETGIPSDFTNAAKGRSSAEGWFGTDKGLGVVADFFTDTYVAYTRDPETLRGKSQVYRRGKLLKTVDMDRAMPHNFIINIDFAGNDVWVAAAKGLGWAIGDGYYKGVKRPAAAKP